MGYYADNALGKELKRLRKERNFTQEEIAEHLHITRQTYSHYETGRIQPSVQNLFVLKTLYNVPLSDLLKYMDIDSECGGGHTVFAGRRTYKLLQKIDWERKRCYFAND